MHTELVQGTPHKLYAKFSDEHAELKTMRSSYLVRKNRSVPIEKYETEMLRKKKPTSWLIKRPLRLTWEFNVSKVHGLSLGQRTTDFDMQKEKPFWQVEIYTTPWLR